MFRFINKKTHTKNQTRSKPVQPVLMYRFQKWKPVQGFKPVQNPFNPFMSRTTVFLYGFRPVQKSRCTAVQAYAHLWWGLTRKGTSYFSGYSNIVAVCAPRVDWGPEIYQSMFDNYCKEAASECAYGYTQEYREYCIRDEMENLVTGNWGICEGHSYTMMIKGNGGQMIAYGASGERYTTKEFNNRSTQCAIICN